MDLNNQKIYQSRDNKRVTESIDHLPDQIRQVLEEARLIKIPREFSQATHVVVNGMGGSNLGARIIQTVMADQIKIPLLINPGYQIPAFVGKNTLYVISSYSGTTEEPLSVYKKLKKRKAHIIAITEHGKKSKLAKLMIKDDIPGYIFKPEQNPSSQPRLGIGYTIFGTMIMLAKAGLFKIKVREIEDIIASLEIWSRKLRPASPSKNNPAKKLAKQIHGQAPILAGAEFLAGNLHVLRNQINENAKLFSSYLILPELNHYAMEGLVNPSSNKKSLVFLFFNSNLYDQRIQKRLALTKRVVSKNGIKVLEYKLKGKTKLEQAFEMLQFGTWLSYYLGILNKVNPVKIPYVDWFKKQLK